MHRSTVERALVALLFALVTAPGLADPGAGLLEGHWVLAEQTYGEGRSNLAERIPDLRLDVVAGLGQAEVTVRTAGETREGLPWPAVVTDGVSTNLEILEKSIDTGSGTLRTHYKILPPNEDGLTLDIVEEYVLEPRTDSLEGAVTVEMSRHGEPRGGFVLHRRFVRARR